METSALIKKVRQIEIKTKGLSNNILAGIYHSAFKGRGMEFSEVRAYQPGDDVRSIDWKVTAKNNHPYIKLFTEERELTIMLLIDVSASQSFGTQNMLKKELVTEISAVLAFSAIQNNDKIGVIFFSDKVERFIAPKKGKSHVLRIIRELLDFTPEHNKTSLSAALAYFSNVIKKKSITFIISDFLDKGYEDAVKIAGFKHEIIALRIYDPLEAELPAVGLVRVKDAETGGTLVIDTSSKKVRNNYNQYWKDSEKRLRESLRKSNGGYIKIRTDQPYIKPLLEFFHKQ